MRKIIVNILVLAGLVLSSLGGLTRGDAALAQAEPVEGGAALMQDYDHWIYLPIVQKGSAQSSMVTVDEGEFLMGCDPDNNADFPCESDELKDYGDYEGTHPVYLSKYRIDLTEVTNSQYALCVSAGACSAPTNMASWERVSYYDNLTYANFPVIYVTWEQASQYCSWAGKRLPTEAEWEKAARGTYNTRPFPWGTTEPNCDLANFRVDGYGYCYPVGESGDTSPVGYFPNGRSYYGVLDMAGNVNEWVSDWYSRDYYDVSPYANPTGPDSPDSYTGKVIRGGNYYFTSEYLRLAFRNYYPPEWSYDDVGFRCAQDAP